MPELRVMSFNIMGESFPENGINIWANRAALNARVIRLAMPHLIGMQEVAPENLAYYKETLPEYEQLTGEAYGEAEYPAFSAILWHRDHFDLMESGVFWLSRTPEIESVDWGVPYPMLVNWARLRRKRDGAALLHFNTHLEDGPHGETQRVESSKLIARKADEMQAGACLLLTGDFNCNAGSQPYQNLINAGFADTFLSAGNVDGRISTFHGLEGEAYDTRHYGGPDADPFWRVDWIMLREGVFPRRVETCKVITDAEPPLYPSDHYPVLATLTA